MLGAGWCTLGALLVPLTSRADEGPRSLTVVAASSARPATCGAEGQLWFRTKHGAATQGCALLLRASARLAEDPAGARALAEQAARVVPTSPEPQVLLARACLALGDVEAATEHLAAARRSPRDALRAPLDLLAGARIYVHGKDYSEALALYRRLVPRLSLLADARERQRALLEAAVVAQWVSPDHLAEARAYAQEARRAGGLYFAELARGVLALSLSRQGREAEAREVAREVGGPWLLAWLFEREPAPRGRAYELTPVFPAAEREALLAILAEPVDGELAQQTWGEYARVARRSNAPPHLVEHARQRTGASDAGALFDDPDDAEDSGGAVEP